MYDAEVAIFGKDGAEDFDFLERAFHDEKCVIAVLKDGFGNLVGHSVTTPIHDEEVPTRHNPEKRKDDHTTAYIHSTAILPEHRGKKLVGRLIDLLEEELRRKGFQYVERDAAIENGYADSIERHYGDRIVASYDHVHPKHGPQRFFRIKLS